MRTSRKKIDIDYLGQNLKVSKMFLMFLVQIKIKIHAVELPFWAKGIQDGTSPCSLRLCSSAFGPKMMTTTQMLCRHACTIVSFCPLLFKLMEKCSDVHKHAKFVLPYPVIL